MVIFDLSQHDTTKIIGAWCIASCITLCITLRIVITETSYFMCTWWISVLANIYMTHSWSNSSFTVSCKDKQGSTLWCLCYIVISFTVAVGSCSLRVWNFPGKSRDQKSNVSLSQIRAALDLKLLVFVVSTLKYARKW